MQFGERGRLLAIHHFPSLSTRGYAEWRVLIGVSWTGGCTAPLILMKKNSMMEWPGLWNNACTLGPHSHMGCFCLVESNSITHQPRGANRWEALPKTPCNFARRFWGSFLNSISIEQSWKVAIHLIEEANIPKIIWRWMCTMTYYHHIIQV